MVCELFCCTCVVPARGPDPLVVALPEDGVQDLLLLLTIVHLLYPGPVAVERKRKKELGR